MLVALCSGLLNGFLCLLLLLLNLLLPLLLFLLQTLLLLFLFFLDLFLFLGELGVVLVFLGLELFLLIFGLLFLSAFFIFDLFLVFVLLQLSLKLLTLESLLIISLLGSRVSRLVGSHVSLGSLHLWAGPSWDNWCLDWSHLGLGLGSSGLDCGAEVLEGAGLLGCGHAHCLSELFLDGLPHVRVHSGGHT